MPTRGRVAETLRHRRARREAKQVERRRELAEHPTLTIRLRQWRRASSLVFWTLFAYGLFICCWPLALVAPKQMRPIRRSLMKFWGTMSLWSLNMKLKVYGRAPEAPCFLVVNHISYVDILVMAQQCGPVFVAKAEMDTWPLWGWMMRKSHQIFIERGNFRDSQRVLNLLSEVLDEKDALVIFAEGRCSPGAEVLPFRPSLFEIAAERQYPVHYASLSFEVPEGEPAASDSISWWRWEPLRDAMMRLFSLSSSTTTIYYSREPVIASTRKELAQRTHAGCVELFKPISQGVLPELPAPPNLPRLYRETAKKADETP